MYNLSRSLSFSLSLSLSLSLSSNNKKLTTISVVFVFNSYRRKELALKLNLAKQHVHPENKASARRLHKRIDKEKLVSLATYHAVR